MCPNARNPCTRRRLTHVPGPHIGRASESVPDRRGSMQNRDGGNDPTELQPSAQPVSHRQTGAYHIKGRMSRNPPVPGAAQRRRSGSIAAVVETASIDGRDQRCLRSCSSACLVEHPLATADNTSRHSRYRWRLSAGPICGSPVCRGGRRGRVIHTH